MKRRRHPLASVRAVGLFGLGVCRVCGCTDYDCTGCIKLTGKPCRWTDAKRNVCTACVPPRKW